MRRLRLPRLTIRARLTLVYGGLFLLAGIVLLGVTYVLVSQRLRDGQPTVNTDLPTPATASPTGGSGAVSPPAVPDTTFSEVTNDALNSLLTQGAIALAIVSAAAIALGWLIATVPGVGYRIDAAGAGERG